eukprot:scaffold226352_cov21-Tisochrysis_lutea.AAC.1
MATAVDGACEHANKQQRDINRLITPEIKQQMVRAVVVVVMVLLASESCAGVWICSGWYEQQMVCVIVMLLSTESCAGITWMSSKWCEQQMVHGALVHAAVSRAAVLSDEQQIML